MTVTLYHGSTNLKAYEATIFPAVGHIIEIDDDEWVVRATRSSITESGRRSQFPYESDLIVEVIPYVKP
jgi:hypothetical protein